MFAYENVSKKELYIDNQIWRLFSKYLSYLLLLIRKKSINSLGDMISYTPQIKHKNKSKSFILLCKKVLDAVCTHVTSSATSRDSVAKLTTDSYQFWVAH